MEWKDSDSFKKTIQQSLTFPHAEKIAVPPLFPEFNIYSTPLLILVIQGLLFAYLLLARFLNQRQGSDLIMGILLLVMVYHRTAYTIGFMGWYDTYTNTKVNYFLFSLGLSLGPLIYLYVRTTLVPPFRLERRDWKHFFPLFVYLFYRLVLFLHDVQQEDWNKGFEGLLMRQLHVAFVDPIVTILEYSWQLVYYAFTVQLFIRYRHRIKVYFSDTTPIEFNWIRNFLAVYTFLFVYGYVTDFVDALIVDLDYINRWWVHLCSAIAIVYLGIKAYFTDIQKLHHLTRQMQGAGFDEKVSPEEVDHNVKNKIQHYMEDKKAFLDPQLTLRQVANGVGTSMQEVSAAINNGFGVNFNEWINQYRVAEVKQKLSDPANNHLSLVAIAFDSGFNSKATFNRVFKQIAGQSPSEYKAAHQK